MSAHLIADRTLPALIKELQSKVLPAHLVIFASGPSVKSRDEQLLELIFGKLQIPHLTLIASTESVGHELIQRFSLLIERHQAQISLLGCLPEILSSETKTIIAQSAAAPGESSKHHLYLMLGDSSRKEILQAVKRYVIEKAHGSMNGHRLDEETFRGYLHDSGFPDPDLVISTGGRRSFQNALLWQLAYAEFWICEKTWAELRDSDILDAIESFQRRERRFGGLLRHK